MLLFMSGLFYEHLIYKKEKSLFKKCRGLWVAYFTSVIYKQENFTKNALVYRFFIL